MDKYLCFEWLAYLGINAAPDRLWMRALYAALVFLLCLLAWRVSRDIAHQHLPAFILYSKNRWDDVLMENNFFRYLALLVPGWVLYMFVPLFLCGYPKVLGLTQNLIAIGLVVGLVLCLNAFLNTALKIYRTYPIAEEIPLTRFTRILKYGIYSCAFLVGLALVLDKSLFYFFNSVETINRSSYSESHLTRLMIALIAVLISFMGWRICRHVAQNVLPKLAAMTENRWDDALLHHHFFQRLALIVPGIILNRAIPIVFYYNAKGAIMAQNAVGLYMTVAVVFSLDALLSAFLEIYRGYPLSKEIDLTIFFRLLKIILYGCGILFARALFLTELPLSEGNSGDLLTRFIVAVVAILVSIAAWFIAQHVVHRVMSKLAAMTENRWDDALVENNVFRNLTLFVPGLVLIAVLPFVFGEDTGLALFARKTVAIYFIFALVFCIDALLSGLLDIYRTFPLSQDIPLTGSVQVLKIILYGCGLLFALALILNRSPLYLFSGLGAMTAVLMLVFKDPILGFVAGIQLIGNKMLKQGDWIEMPKYGADGDVVDITLTTVKVRNFDKTITTIPTYALIADSFKNWRGMKESGGRRIKRAICIDINSIRFCDEEMLRRFAKNEYISEYIKKKKQEILEHNTKLIQASDTPQTFRRLTNIGTFRAYIIAYLRNHPMIHQDMTFLVRQLAPTANGLPIEVYVFCKDNTWAVYEEVQSDIFDHLLAIASEFDLRVYQLPSGKDVKDLENIFGSK